MENNESAFDRFRRVHEVKGKCLKNHDSYFVGHHTSTCTVHNLRTDEDLEVTLVLSDKDGADEAYLYVHIDDDFQVSDYFTWKTTTFFAFEQVQIVKEMDFIKYKVLECNAFINDEFWGYFIGPLKAVKDTLLSSNYETSRGVPLLIAPIREELVIGGQIIFFNQVWDIEDADIYTINNIGYYALTRGINSRDEEDVDFDEYVEEDTHYMGEDVDLDTENGYYLSSGVKVKLVKRTDKKITIKCLESGKVTIKTLKNGILVENTFDVKENV